MPRPKSILWVDDEVDGLAAHRRFLEQQGFAVAQAAHGDDALAMLRRQPYSIVLLDEQMPGRRGLDLLPEIRAEGLPYIEVTTDPDNLPSQRVIEANGGVLFERFTKPPQFGGKEGVRYRIAFR